MKTMRRNSRFSKPTLLARALLVDFYMLVRLNVRCSRHRNLCTNVTAGVYNSKTAAVLNATEPVSVSFKPITLLTAGDC